MLKTLFVKKSAINFLKEDIEEITGEFVNLVELKKSLEDEKARLDKEKKELDQSYALVAAEKSRVQKELNAQIEQQNSVKRTINGITAELSNLQYNLLLSRQGGTYVNPASVPSGGDYWGSLEGFKEAPSGSFAVYSIGAFTHRNGMSQWGAKARAERGENYESILRAYYLGINFATEATDSIQITVKFCDKVGGITKCNVCPNERLVTYNFETDYLYRLGEMPEDWSTEALKAQAIAARTYALNATNYGRNNPIRGDECGQAIGGQKLGRWKEAVDSTKGMVMHKNGGVFSSQYAAINGGWIDNPLNPVGWDTTDKKGDDPDWISRAWDTLSETGKVGTYYWFYKTWYRSGYSVGTTVSSTSCSRTPWLSQTEMADIINAFLVGKARNWSDSRIIPIKDACHPRSSEDPNLYNPYSHEELRFLSPKPVSKVYSVVVRNSNGSTSEVIFQTDAGPISISGKEFKTAYNLRAPGNLRIPQGSDGDAFWHFEIRMK
ncbi:MAG TPA: SpoIID/LytB domain-containing protein [Candidatus Dojkabacteria bacterium]|nr:SpoIID/LytB domain-containing protein [Candidatus Dojkabacteria bacterium]